MDDLISPLVDVATLRALSGRNAVKIIDGSWRMPGGGAAFDDFVRRRIPGAAFFDLEGVSDAATDLPHMLPDAMSFSAAVGALGVRREDPVVIYDDAGLFSAARVWWTFRAFGHPSVRILDGGLPAWIAAGGPTESGEPTYSPVEYGAAVLEPGLIADEDAVRNALADPFSLVLDARPRTRFLGLASEPRPGLRSGAMPGAVSLPYGELIDADGRLKAGPALRRILGAAGVRGGRSVVATCGSGVTAAVLMLALARVGHERAALYDGSWAAWGREDPDLSRPVVRSAAPHGRQG